MSKLPPLPAGFIVEETPDLPPGFVMETDAVPGFDAAAFGDDFKAARAAIDKLPEGMRQKAIDAYAQDYVTRERKDGGIGQTLTDHARMFARNVPLVGEFADEANALTAWLGGGDYELAHAAEQERRRQIDATDRAGVNIPLVGEVDTGDVAKTAGLVSGIAAAPAVTPFKAGTTVAAGGNAAANAALYTGAEAAGRASGGVGERIIEAAPQAAMAAPLGGAIGMAAAPISRAVSNWANKGKPVYGEPVPKEVLKARSQAGYQAADDAGVIFSPKGVQRIEKEIVGDLTDFGYHPGLQPKIKTLLSEVERLKEGPVTLKGLETFRKMVGGVTRSLEPSERMAAGKVMERLDDLMLNPKKGDILSGNAQGASRMLMQARQDWKTMRKVELIEEAIERAEDRIQSTYSGGNADNAIRQQLRRLLDNKKLSRMFSKGEQDEIRSVVNGQPIGDLMRSVGKWAPSGMGRAGYIGLIGGSMMTGQPVAAGALGTMALTTTLAKALGNRMTRGNAGDLVQKISGGQIGTKFTRWQKVMQGAATEGTKRTATKSLATAIANATGISASDVMEELVRLSEGGVEGMPLPAGGN